MAWPIGPRTLLTSTGTEYGLAGPTTTALLTAGLRESFTEPLRPGTNPTICQAFHIRRLPYSCPARWGSIAITQLLDGTSRLPDYHWGRPGNTMAQTEAACAKLPLEGRGSAAVHYTTCANVVMGLLASAEPASNQPGSHWMPFGFGPSGQKHSAAAFERRLAGRLYDGTHSSTLALDYDLSGRHSSHNYSDYYAAYTSPAHLYFYDNLLFSGRYMSIRSNTDAELASRGISAPPDPGIDRVHWADAWKTGYLFGSPVTYTTGSLYNFQTANLRFPTAGITVIVMSNTATTRRARHRRARGRLCPRLALGKAGRHRHRPTTADLIGTFRRPQRAADLFTVAYVMEEGYLSGTIQSIC